MPVLSNARMEQEEMASKIAPPFKIIPFLAHALSALKYVVGVAMIRAHGEAAIKNAKDR